MRIMDGFCANLGIMCLFIYYLRIYIRKLKIVILKTINYDFVAAFAHTVMYCTSEVKTLLVLCPPF